MTTIAGASPTQRPDEDASAPQPAQPEGLFHYIARTCWIHQIPLVTITIVVFLLEVVPLELQRRVVNDLVKNRAYSEVVWLCAIYVAAVLVQGSTKLGLNMYRAWVGERAKRELRRHICRTLGTERADPTETEIQGTAVAMIVAEVEPIGGFIGESVSEPLLQGGILATVIAYIMHLDIWMGAVALVLFVPQLVFVPLMQHAMNRRTAARVWLLRRIGAGVIAADANGPSSAGASRIDRVFALNIGIYEFKFTMNFLMNLCSHLQIIAALLLGGWWVLNGDIQIGGVVAFISGLGRLNDPWGDLVNYFRDVSVTIVKFRLLTEAMARAAAPDSL